MSTKLYVGNLPYETTESDLQELFESAGAVASVNVIRDRATGQARGFAFVEMSDAEGAQRAISELNSHQYGGRKLTVNEAKPMESRGGGGGGFGGNRGGNRGGGGFGGGRGPGESRW
jgi:RNA recognition motif-containing protein